MTPAMRRGVTALASLTLAATALGGTAVAQSPGTPTSGGTLVVADWQAASQLNPYFTNAFADTAAYTLSWRPLVTINDDGEWVADLAAEVPSVDNGGLVPGATPADGFTVNLKLKPGLMWSDGQPLTLNDFKFGYDYALKIAAANVGCTLCSTWAPLIDPTLTGDALYAPENQFVESITVSDDGLSAAVKFRQNYAGWLGVISNAMLPEHTFKDMTPADASSLMSVGTDSLLTVPASGPFTITAASSDGIDFARNDNWKASAPALLDGVRYRFYGSKDGMITAFLNGEVDLALDMTQGDYPAISGVNPDIGRAELDSVWQYEHLDMNVTRPGLNDPEVRKAVAMAIDKKDMISVIFPGTELEPACSQAPPGTWWRIDVECPAYDPAGAMAVLDAAGWTVNPDTGLREKTIDGQVVPLRFQMCTSSGNPTRLTELGKVNQYLTAIGIPSDIQTADASSVYFASWADTTPDTQCSIYRGTYDIADFAYILGGDLYSNYYYTYHSSQIPPVSNNTTRISVPALDEALDKIGSEIDPEAQKAAAATMQEELAKALPEIPLYYRAEATGVSNHVGGYAKFNPSSAGPTWNAQDWYFVP
jgi:peptide/nickel transport system substrate-binding protein